MTDKDMKNGRTESEAHSALDAVLLEFTTNLLHFSQNGEAIIKRIR